ncbi:hypothetical protein HY375_02310 [Candidatus Berkelbacteria bacterium]|nr:hypothetical protein [Candidatus Berkelbacteria bacterium]
MDSKSLKLLDEEQGGAQAAHALSILARAEEDERWHRSFQGEGEGSPYRYAAAYRYDWLCDGF